MRLLMIVLILTLGGCSAIKVERLDPNQPSGLPFYLTKPMIKVTKIKYVFYDKSKATTVQTVDTVEKEIVTVPDKSAAYTVNHLRAFAGETKFKLERLNSYDISKIETENKEGVTEFLKGLIEGAKTLTEVAKEADKAKAAPASVYSEAEGTYFANLAQKDILVFKTIVDIAFEELK